MTLLHQDNLITILVCIYYFVDEFIKTIVTNMQYALEAPSEGNPPIKKHNLTLSQLVTLALFCFFTGHRNWKDFHQHIRTYHQQDFKDVPKYSAFIAAMNKLSFFALIVLQAFMQFFRNITASGALKFADSMKLKVCEIKREFSHKVCVAVASKSKSSMGWFYGFKLHIICNQLMHILNFRITTGSTDERKTLEKMWNNIFGMIIADAGYIGKKWQQKAQNIGKHLFTAARASMKIYTASNAQTPTKSRVSFFCS